MTTTITPAAGVNVALLQLGPGATGYGAIDWRRMMLGPSLQTGVLNPGGWKVTAGGSMTTSIAASGNEGAIIKGINITAQGLYYVAPHTSSIIETHTAAHATLPRIDQVVLEMLDASHDGGASNTVHTRVIDGTATAGATLDNRNGASSLPNNSIRLADVLVAAASGVIAAGNIRDRRPWARGAYTRISRVTSAYSTSSTTPSLMDSVNLAPRVECTGNPIRVYLTAQIGTAAGNNMDSHLWIDGSMPTDGWTIRTLMPTGGGASGFHGHAAPIPVAGSHIIGPAFSSPNAVVTTWQATATNPLTFEIEEIVGRATSGNSSVNT